MCEPAFVPGERHAGGGFFVQGSPGALYTDGAFQILHEAIMNAIEESGITDEEEIKRILEVFDVNEMESKSKETADILPPNWRDVNPLDEADGLIP